MHLHVHKRSIHGKPTEGDYSTRARVTSHWAKQNARSYSKQRAASLSAEDVYSRSHVPRMPQAVVHRSVRRISYEAATTVLPRTTWRGQNDWAFSSRRHSAGHVQLACTHGTEWLISTCVACEQPIYSKSTLCLVEVHERILQRRMSELCTALTGKGSSKLVHLVHGVAIGMMSEISRM
jgi:hypothetical protein